MTDKHTYISKKGVITMKAYNINEHETKRDYEIKQHEKEERKLKRKVVARNVSIIVLLIIIIILLLRGCGSDVGTRFEPLLQQGSVTVQGDDKPEVNKLYVTMPVVDDFTVSTDKPDVVLYCPEENKGLFYITYTFTDEDGDVIYQSNPAEGGTKWSVNFKELLPEGKHDVTVKLSSMYCDTGKAANGVVSDITITVAK